MCSQATKVKQHLTGAQHRVFMDADVTWVSMKNGVSGFLVRDINNKMGGGGAWTVGARDRGYVAQHPTLVV